MATSKVDDRTAREQLVEALHHNKKMDRTLDLSDQAFQKAQKDIARLQGDAARMEAVITGLRENNQQLAGKINEAHKPYIKRITELIDFCKQHGINPDTGKKK